MQTVQSTQLDLFSAMKTPPLAPKETSEPSKPVQRPPRIKMIQTLLRTHLDPRIKIVWTDNKSTLLSRGSGKNKHQIRIHQMFLSGTDELFIAIGKFFKSGHKPSGQIIDDFIRSQEHLLMHHTESLPLNTGKGRHHDLHQIQELLSRVYFKNAFNLEVQWGRPENRKRRRSIQLGSYDPRTERITIHPSLDQKFVPEMCVARILHHEMCHHAFPAIKSPKGRRMVHHQASKVASLF